MRTKNDQTDDEDVLAQGVKSTSSELIANKFSTRIESLLEEVLRTSFHNAQCGIQSVV